jgi:hypothetical protein
MLDLGHDEANSTPGKRVETGRIREESDKKENRSDVFGNRTALLFGSLPLNPRALQATAPNVSAMSSTARHADRARDIACAHGAPYAVLHRYG